MTRTTRRTAPRALPAGLLAAALLTAGVALAAPALAVADPSRPDARVTHAPSCHPGGLTVEVVAGSAPYSVRLASTRAPQGEDEALLDPGETVVLETGDVDWGETIDGRLEYAALDGSGVTYTDELEDYSFTRPTEEDCAAIAVPPAPAAAPAGDVGKPADDGAAVAPADDDVAAVEGGARGPEPVAAPPAPALTARVAPAAETRGLTRWPVFFAGLALLGSTAGLVLVGLRRWTAVRRPFGSG